MILMSLKGEITQFSSKLSVKPDAWDTVLGKAVVTNRKLRHILIENSAIHSSAKIKKTFKKLDTVQNFV